MIKHTPGPWRIDPVVSTLIVGTKDPMPIICDTEAASPFDVEVDKANARLIAAAPDLLEAMKNLENDDGHIPKPLWDLCLKAIAKAEGRA